MSLEAIDLNLVLVLHHVEVALQGKHPIDYVDGVLSRLGYQRSIAISVPQFALAASASPAHRTSRCFPRAWRRDWPPRCNSRFSGLHSNSRRSLSCSSGTNAAT